MEPATETSRNQKHHKCTQTDKCFLVSESEYRWLNLCAQRMFVVDLSKNKNSTEATNNNNTVENAEEDAHRALMFEDISNSSNENNNNGADNIDENALYNNNEGEDNTIRSDNETVEVNQETRENDRAVINIESDDEDVEFVKITRDISKNPNFESLICSSNDIKRLLLQWQPITTISARVQERGLGENPEVSKGQNDTPSTAENPEKSSLGSHDQSAQTKNTNSATDIPSSENRLPHPHPFQSVGTRNHPIPVSIQTTEAVPVMKHSLVASNPFQTQETTPLEQTYQSVPGSQRHIPREQSMSYYQGTIPSSQLCAYPNMPKQYRPNPIYEPILYSQHSVSSHQQFPQHQNIEEPVFHPQPLMGIPNIHQQQELFNLRQQQLSELSSQGHLQTMQLQLAVGSQQQTEQILRNQPNKQQQKQAFNTCLLQRKIETVTERLAVSNNAEGPIRPPTLTQYQRMPQNYGQYQTPIRAQYQPYFSRNTSMPLLPPNQGFAQTENRLRLDKRIIQKESTGKSIRPQMTTHSNQPYRWPYPSKKHYE